MEITAIITTYNSEMYLEETINSVLNQSLDFDEIIIVDDCSIDTTPSIIKKFEHENNKIRAKFLTENYGPSYTRNIATLMNKSKWIIFIDHDDLLDKEIMKNYRKKLLYSNEENISFIFPKSFQIDRNNKIISTTENKIKQNYRGNLFVRNYILSTTGVLINSDKLKKVKLFDESLIYSQDWDLWLKLSGVGEVLFCEEAKVFIRRHENNTSKNINNYLKDEISIYSKYTIKQIVDEITSRDVEEDENFIDTASVLLKLNYIREAKDMLSKVKNESSKKAFLEGVIFFCNGEFISAEIQFEKVLKYNSNDIAAINNIGCCKRKLNNYKEAIEFFKRAIAINDNFLDAKINLNRINNTKLTNRLLRSELIIYFDNGS